MKIQKLNIFDIYNIFLKVNKNNYLLFKQFFNYFCKLIK